MAKRGGFPGGMGGFGGMNLGNIMKQAQKMQADLTKTQEELASKEFETSCGGGAVEVKVSGAKVLKEIKTKPEVVDPEDVEMLQDMVCAAVNEAIRNINEQSNARLSAVTGGMGLPGMGGGMPGIPGLR